MTEILGLIVDWAGQLWLGDRALGVALCLGALALILIGVSSRRRRDPVAVATSPTAATTHATSAATGAQATPSQPSPSDIDSQIRSLIEADEYERAGDLRAKQGQYDKALSLYQNSGNDKKAALCYLSLKQPGKAAEVYRRMGRLAEAAHYAQLAGDWKLAAESLEIAGDERESAELYERAGELAKAAHILRGIGDGENAARLFERTGLATEAASALLAARGKEPAALRRAGELFETAGELRRAAECLAGAQEWERAAVLFERTQDYALAAQAFERAELFEDAARSYEEAGALPEARANYERSGDVAAAAQISLRLGQLLEAGRGFYQLGSYERAIETLQSISAQSPQFRAGSLLLGRIFLEKGLFARAIEKLDGLGAEPPVSKEDLDVLSYLADAHERQGQILRALSLLEQIADFDPDYAEVPERLAQLQERAWVGSNHTASMLPHNERYELRGEIGRGGMGVVHLAQDRELERPVAVKFLPPELAKQPAAAKMFRQEARAAAAMNHPNIVHVYDVTVIGGRPCMVMEFVQGKTARELMRHEGSKTKVPLSPRRTSEIARDICDALAYAHIQNVIHRDVKPGNIIVADRGHAKLMDFGISKVLDNINVEGQTQAKGTPQYMPPEQILGRDVDGRTDLYALGISMFEVLTGQRPFRGEDVVNQQLHVDMPDPRVICADIPEELAGIIQRACEKRPRDRFQSPREMADALSEFLASSNVF